jgi:hypothetical protein
MLSVPATMIVVGSAEPSGLVGVATSGFTLFSVSVVVLPVLLAPSSSVATSVSVKLPPLLSSVHVIWASGLAALSKLQLPPTSMPVGVAVHR